MSEQNVTNAKDQIKKKKGKKNHTSLQKRFWNSCSFQWRLVLQNQFLFLTFNFWKFICLYFLLLFEGISALQNLRSFLMATKYLIWKKKKRKKKVESGTKKLQIHWKTYFHKKFKKKMNLISKLFLWPTFVNWMAQN